MPEVTSVNVGHVREVTWHGRRIRTGLWKTPIAMDDDEFPRRFEEAGRIEGRW